MSNFNLLIKLTPVLPLYCIRQSNQTAFDPNYQINCDTKLPWRLVLVEISMVQLPNRPLCLTTYRQAKLPWMLSLPYSLGLLKHLSKDSSLPPNNFVHREVHFVDRIKIDC